MTGIIWEAHKELVSSGLIRLTIYRNKVLFDIVELTEAQVMEYQTFYVTYHKAELIHF